MTISNTAIEDDAEDRAQAKREVRRMFWRNVAAVALGVYVSFWAIQATQDFRDAVAAMRPDVAIAGE